MVSTIGARAGATTRLQTIHPPATAAAAPMTHGRMRPFGASSPLRSMRRAERSGRAAMHAMISAHGSKRPELQRIARRGDVHAADARIAIRPVVVDAGDHQLLVRTELAERAA